MLEYQSEFNPQKYSYTWFKKTVENILDSGVNLIGFGEFQQHGLHEVIFQDFIELNGLFEGIFLELPVDFQDSVDYYLKTQSFDKRFENLMQGAEQENKDVRNTFKLLLDFARINSIPEICIDSSKTINEEYNKKTQYGSSYTRGISRDEDMYANVITTLNKKEGKWCLVCHAAHLDYMFDMDEGNPSVGKRLKADLKEKMFTVCLFRLKNAAPRYLLTNQVNSEMSLSFPGDIAKSFDAIITHP